MAMPISKIRQIMAWMSAADLACLELQDSTSTLRLSRSVKAAPVAQASREIPLSPAPVKPVPVAAMATVCGRFLSRHPSRQEPQVKPGERIEPGMLVGLIAVGQVYLPVTATAGGVMGEFMVEDLQLVGYGTPLVSLANDK